MPDVKEEEKTTEEKLAKSSGTDTAKYADQLDDDADKLIDQMNKAREEEGKKAEEQMAELNKSLEEEEEAKKTEEEKKETEDGKEKEAEKKEEKKPDADDEIKPEDTDTVESLTEKLVKSEKRVKDNRSAYTKNKQEIQKKEIASQAIVDNLNQTVFDLKTKVDELAKTKTVKEEKTTEKEIKKTLVNLDKQFETLKNVDPEIAEPIKQIIESIRDSYADGITDLTNQVSTLKTELKNSTDNAQKSAQQTADDAHYGAIEAAHKDWEAVVESPEFNEYIDTLSPRQQVLAKQDLESGSADNIIELFSDYKAAVGIAKEETKKPDTSKTDAKAEKLKAAANLVNPVLNKAKEIKTGPKVKYTRSMIKAMNPVEFAKHEADIDIEAAAGRIGVN